MGRDNSADILRNGENGSVLVRYYPVEAMALFGLFLLWWLIPFSVEFDRLGVYKLTGHLIISLLFLLHGIWGLVLAYRGLVMYDLAATVVVFPLTALLSHITRGPWPAVICLIWVFFAVVFGYVSWHRYSV